MTTYQHILIFFDYFDITHVENEPATYLINTKYTGISGQGIHFVYDLSGIDILFHIYLRHVDATFPDYNKAREGIYVEIKSDYEKKELIIHNLIVSLKNNQELMEQIEKKL